VTLGAADAFFGGVLSGLDVNAIRRTSRCAEEAGHALLQPILVTLQHVHAAEAVLEHRAAQRAGAVGIVFDDRGLKHLDEGDAHALGDGGDVFNDTHDGVQYNNWRGRVALSARLQQIVMMLSMAGDDVSHRAHRNWRTIVDSRTLPNPW